MNERQEGADGLEVLYAWLAALALALALAACSGDPRPTYQTISPQEAADRDAYTLSKCRGRPLVRAACEEEIHRAGTYRDVTEKADTNVAVPKTPKRRKPKS